MKNRIVLLVVLAYSLLSSLQVMAIDVSKKCPTIQEAWVDAGYFVWKDSTQTSLKITKLGAKQDTLPNVCDGEQLTDASWMFSNDDDVVLKEAPFFDSSNITDFSGMFSLCRSLITIPELNTSKGDNFSSMFSYCTKLESVPTLDTSNGTSFIEMFFGCVSLINKPQLSFASLIYDSYAENIFFDTPFEN